jgi:hypothetical protein
MAYAYSTKARDAKRQGGGEIVAFPMGTSATIYKGDIVVIDVNDGYAYPGLADGTLSPALGANDQFAGVAAESKVSTTAGLTYINVYVTGSFEFDIGNAVDTLAQTHFGTVVYLDAVYAGTGNPHTVRVSTTSAKDLIIGRIVGPITTGACTTASKLRIRIDGYAGCQAVAA